jgi:phage baseplate assembly protein W
MARIIKRVHPFDTRQNKKLGVAYPLNEINMRTGTNTIGEQIKTNLTDILVTYPGERVNLPDYGVGVQNLLFENSVDKEMLKTRIQSQVERYLTAISIRDVNISTDNDRGTIFIGVHYVSLIDGTEDIVTVAGS